MSNYRRFASLRGKHQHHRTSHGCWMFKGDCGNWFQFHDDEHFANSVEAGYTISFFTAVPDMALPAAVL